MPSTAFSHVAIGVTDMDRSVAFYRDILGLDKVYEKVQDVNEEGVRPHRRHGVGLAWPGEKNGSFLVLDKQDREGSAHPISLTDFGIHHFGFWVDDIDAIYQRAVKAGCDVMLSPKHYPANPALEPYSGGAPVRTTVIRDPDGNLIQLDEPVKG